jgi:hypothetical protein
LVSDFEIIYCLTNKEKMKKLTFIFAGLIMVALMVSCSKDATNDGDAMLKGAAVYGPSTPITDVTPYIIPGANIGGNRTCAEVAAFWNLDPNPFLCGDKLDYGDYDLDGDKEFNGEFPAGLTVTVTDGKYVTFEMDDCIQIGDKFYKIGAVIVKGSNSANVYYYPNGTMGDSDLASPVNASGKPAGLSNLTFCFIECEQIPLVIAFKSYLNDGVWAVTSGGPGNIDFVAYYDFVPDFVGNKIYYYMNQSMPVGNILVSDVDDDDLWEVTVDNSDMPSVLFTNAYLFVGTLEDYFDTYYLYFPNHIVPASPASSITFELTF